MSTADWGDEPNTVPLFDPCPVCSGTDRWQDLRGNWHCTVCAKDAGRAAMNNTIRLLTIRDQINGSQDEAKPKRRNRAARAADGE